MRAFVVFSGRFPSEKADALFAHENARAFAELGIETALLAPRRLRRNALSERAYRVVYLPTLDLMYIPFIWSLASYINLFVFSCALYLWLRRHAGADDVVLSNEPLPLLFVSYAVRRTLFEIHISPARHAWFYRAVFRRTFLALPISEWNAKLAERYGLPKERILLSRSAVDTAVFGDIDKSASRAKLGLPLHERIAVYTGHLFGWKGVDTLAEAARLVPDIRVMFVGGTSADIARFKEQYSDVPNIYIVGFVPHDHVPLWQAAADVLVIPNSAKEDISLHFTSPMKLFEYMASRRPILASDVPSIREILSDETGYFAKPDDPRSFADALKRIFADSNKAERRASAARAYAENNTWAKRAEHILERCRTL